MALYRLTPPDDLRDPTVVVAFDGWVDAGSAATGASKQLADGGDLVVRRSTATSSSTSGRAGRRSRSRTGARERLTWPALTMRRKRLGERDVLVLTGAEPDFHWRELRRPTSWRSPASSTSSEWISLGAIPAAVPHTRPVPILGTVVRSPAS